MRAEIGTVEEVHAERGAPFLQRNALVNEDGLGFREFRRTLTPRFGLVWSHIALGYLALVAIGAWVILTSGIAPAWLRVAIGAMLFGFFQAFIQLFFHEAAHYNLASRRDANDRLANIFVGAIHGLEIQSYRQVHFEHHRRLGTTMDSERSYFDPLNTRYVAESLLGIKGLKVLGRRDTIVQDPGRARARRKQQLAAAVIHLGVIGVAVWAGEWALGIAWALGTVSVMPLFVSLRQLLEHRSENADASVDYTQTDHGEVNRLFGEGPVASTLGGAGFNRHLLHHWEPQISYTRLGEVERYLMRTSAAPALDARRSTYWETLWALITW